MLEKKDLDLEKTVLVGVITKSQNDNQSKEYLKKEETRFVQSSDLKEGTTGLQTKQSPIF